MDQVMLFVSFQLLLVHYTTQDYSEIKDCGEDASIECPGLSNKREEFTAVAWYKIGKFKEGVIRKDKGEELPLLYNFSRVARFGENYNLFLSNVTPKDSGTYECAISASVGHQNEDHRVNLLVRECKDELTTKTGLLSPNQTETFTPKQVDELPIKWSLIGYTAVAVVKILLSSVCIKVIHIISSR